jgi:hypothetical protein
MGGTVSHDFEERDIYEWMLLGVLVVLFFCILAGFAGVMAAQMAGG